MNRRKFLKASSAVCASSLFIPNIIRAENLGGQKLRLAMIGVGGRGAKHVDGLSSEQFVAFCDVDEVRAAKAFNQYPNVPRFSDFRVMFDKMGDQFDAVSIAVPDHMHYPIALWAMANGKHVLCEKPLVRTFEEAMLLKEAARQSGVITQMGNQGHANSGLRDIEEWIDAGLIGDVEEVYHWTNRPIWPQGMSSWPQAQPSRSSIDWNLWLGVAPERSYSEEIAPFNWRGFWDYGSGAIGDIACHAMDVSYTPLKLGFPSRVVSDSVGTTEVAFPTESTIYFEFPAANGRGPVRMTWMDGSRRPLDVPFVPNSAIQADPERNKRGMPSGSVIVGSKGSILADMYAKRGRIFPDEYFRQLRKDKAMPAKTLDRVDGTHFMEWVDGIKAGRQPNGNIVDYAADFTGTALIGAISLAVQGPLEFDSERLQFSNSAQANSLLKSQYEYRPEFFAG
ncbi:MAG: Gfo/Idh/MocA family oxidoreductase [Verrucomicrobiota bacterium]